MHDLIHCIVVIITVVNTFNFTFNTVFEVFFVRANKNKEQERKLALDKNYIHGIPEYTGDA